ncbi:MAG: hypothetical protein K0M40_22555 [Prolixibacteraceae bacterium]|nr:hypothetical protein [Prolixibacteraceae bacterium]
MNNNPKTGKGKKRLYEVSCVVWVDLLAYGSMLAEANFDPTDAISQKAVVRLMDFHKITSEHAHRYFPIHAINDGAVIFRDLSPRTKSVTFDFLTRAINLYQKINDHDIGKGFPGARMVISCGFRVRTNNTEIFREHGKIKVIKAKLKKGSISADQAINESFSTRPNFGIIPELQANFAFTKSFLVDDGGTAKGFPGPNCYIELSMFTESIPDWISFEKHIGWEGKGMKATFGQFKSIDRELANSSCHEGILDAFDIAKNISIQDNITNVLVNSTIKDMRSIKIRVQKK